MGGPIKWLGLVSVMIVENLVLFLFCLWNDRATTRRHWHALEWMSSVSLFVVHFFKFFHFSCSIFVHWTHLCVCVERFVLIGRSIGPLRSWSDRGHRRSFSSAKNHRLHLWPPSQSNQTELDLSLPIVTWLFSQPNPFVSHSNPSFFILTHLDSP